MTSIQPLNPSRHIPALDGLRGFAVLMVFYYHTCNVPTVPEHWRIFAGMGWSGVDLFFVLSGYLITNILVTSRDSITYYISFYARRALRIGPVYYLALAIIIFVQPHLYHHMHPHRPIPVYSWHQQALYWFNLSNLRSAFYPIEIPLASIYWSLAIEEQFYALWPTIVRRITNRTILIVCICGVSLSMLLRCLPPVQAWNHTYDNFIYRLTPFRLDGLLLGALLAVYLQSRPDPLRLRRFTVGAFLVGLSALLLSSRGFTAPSSIAMSKFGYTALALIFAAMVSTCVAPQGKIGRALASFFSLSVLRSFGKYSYFIYVFHLMILYALGHLLDRVTHSFNIVLGTYLSSFMGLIICYALAAISWHLMEAPVLSFKRFFPYRVQPVPQKHPLESTAIR